MFNTKVFFGLHIFRHVMITFVKDQIIVPEDQYNRRSHIRSLSDMLYFPAST